MEMDREDGTEFVLSFVEDVNENRAEGCKTHTLQPLAPTRCVHRNSGFPSGPDSPVRANRVTCEESEGNGFPEHDGGESKPDTSGHIRTPDGDTGCFGVIDPDRNQNGNSDHSDADLTESRLVNSANGEDVNLWGFPTSPRINRGTASIGETTGSLITSGQTSDTRGTHSSWFKSDENASVHGHDGLLTASGHAKTSAEDVRQIPGSTLVIGESSGNQKTSAGTPSVRGTNKNWDVSGDAAGISETNINRNATRTINTSDGDHWEFHASLAVISAGETNGNQATSGNIMSTPLSCVSSGAFEETSGPSANVTASEEATNTWISSTPLQTVDSRGTSGDLTASGKTDGARCTQVSSGVTEDPLQTRPRVADDSLTTSGETAASRKTNSNFVHKEETPGACEPHTPYSFVRVAYEKLLIDGTSASLSTSGETSGTKRTSTMQEKKTSQICENNPSLSGAGETAKVGGKEGDLTTSGETASADENQNHLSTSGETAGTERSNPGPAVAGIGGRNMSMLDDKIAGVDTGEPVSGASLVVSGAISDTLPRVDRALPQGLQLGNYPDCLRERVGNRPGSCCTESEMKIPNGDVNHGGFQTDQAGGPVTSGALDKGVRVGNCGYLVINRRSISGTSSIPVYSIREPWNATEPQQEVESVSESGADTISNVSSAEVHEEVSKQETVRRAEHSEAAAARPWTLRTNPVLSLSCDSTPLSDHNAAYFVDDGDMDVIMNSLELGRRQSAPENLQDPDPAGESTADRRRGLADFLTRYGRRVTPANQNKPVILQTFNLVASV